MVFLFFKIIIDNVIEGKDKNDKLVFLIKRKVLEFLFQEKLEVNSNNINEFFSGIEFLQYRKLFLRVMGDEEEVGIIVLILIKRERKGSIENLNVINENKSNKFVLKFR